MTAESHGGHVAHAVHSELPHGHEHGAGKGKPGIVHDASGLDIGGDYATHTGGLHELTGIHLNHVSLLNFNPEDLVAAVIALEAMGFIGEKGNELHGYHPGPLSAILPGARYGSESTVHSEQGRVGKEDTEALKDAPEKKRKKRPSNYRPLFRGKSNLDTRLVELWWWPHNYCDPAGFIEKVATAPEGQFLPECNARGLGMKRLFSGYLEPANVDIPISSVEEGYREFPGKMLSSEPFTAPDNKSKRPMGIFKGAKVKRTRDWRRTYQRLRGREWYRTYLIVSGTQWEVEIEWHGKPYTYWVTKVQYFVWSCETGAQGLWRYMWDGILEHRKCAESLAEATIRYLSARPAVAEARLALAALAPSKWDLPVPERPAKVQPFFPVMIGVPAPDTSIGVDDEERARGLAQDGDDPKRGPNVSSAPY